MRASLEGHGFGQPVRPKVTTPHTIAWTSYSPENGPCALRCTCEAELGAASPVALDAAFRAHRRSVGLRVNVSHDRAFDW